MSEPNPNPTQSPTVGVSSIPPVTASHFETLGAESSDTPPQSGRIGEYVLLSELGRGGMGVVYRAEDPNLKREIALKVMLPQFAANPRTPRLGLFGKLVLRPKSSTITLQPSTRSRNTTDSRISSCRS